QHHADLHVRRRTAAVRAVRAPGQPLMEPDRVFGGAGDPPGCSSMTTIVDPADCIEFRESDWAAAMVVVVSGRLHLECRSGERASFDAGAVLFLTGLDLRRIVNPGLVPLVLKSIRRRRTDE